MASGHLWATKLTDYGTSAEEEIGAIRTEYDSTHKCFKTYKYVLMDTDTSCYVGACLAYRLTSTIATTDESDAEQNLAAGVCAHKIPANNYGWIQVGGFHNSIHTNDNTVVKGMSLVLSTSDGVADTVAVGTAPTQRPLAIVVAAGATSVSAQGIICCGIEAAI